MDNFVHLHNHSEYSTMDGFSKIKDIVSRAKEIGQKAIALTDHGNINGCYKFYTECKKQRIKPILGIEAYCVENYNKEQGRYHITLLCKDLKGWKNLLALHKLSYDNFYYKQRISFEDLIEHKEGLVVLSGCPSGILSKHLITKDMKKAESNLLLFQKEFKDDFYIEIMFHHLDFQEELNHNLRQLAFKHKIKTVATNDCHYCKKEDHDFQNYLTCDFLKTTIHEERHIGLTVPEFYIKKRDEMMGIEEEKDATLEIADKCDITFGKKKFLLPKVENQEETFVKLINEGIDQRKVPRNEIYLSRLREEYKVIQESDLMGYFLLVQDYIQYARDNGVIVGPGRGSVGGCLIGYLIGIHDVDPIKHKLLFSRFYNSGRKDSLPDIDTDFPEKQIDLIRQYVKEKYGENKVCHIGTHTYLHDKSALKLVCRVLGVDFSTANHYSSIVKDDKQTKQLILNDPAFKNIYEKSQKFLNLAIHSSIHAAGIVISPVNLATKVPLRINKDNGLYVSDWDMKDVEDIGLVKFDFLSLNTLDVISETLDNVNIKLKDIPTDDEETFETISTTNNVGIFQLSSDGISGIANALEVESIDDIAAVVALYRPGTIASGLHNEYVERKHGRSSIEYDHPLLETVLSDTYGLMIYQEQVTKTAMVLANFDETEADLLRKAIGKKIPELMKQQKEKFIDGCVNNNITKDLAKHIWDKIDKCSGYLFNRSHSVGYGYITYYTAYLKTHYPLEFMSALLNNNYSDNKKLYTYLKECDSMGIDVVPPSVTMGSENFVPKEGKIIFGLMGINGLGQKTAEEVYKQKYKSFEDFCLKFKPKSSTLVCLIEAGAFDEFGYKRNQLLQSVNYISELIKNNKKNFNPKAKSLLKVKNKFEIPDIEELPVETLANKEHNRLNAYLVNNPLKEKQLATPDELEGFVFIEGYVISVEEYITKKSKQSMCFLQVATNLGEIKALIFPKLYIEKQHIIRQATYIAIEGNYKDNSLLCTNIWRKK